jgi:type II secretory pathway component PulC
MEKKEVDVKSLERLISSFFPKEKIEKQFIEGKPSNVEIAPSYFKVIGYILGQPSAVLLKFKEKTLVLTEGETKKGIKLLKVTPDYVLIEYNGRQLKVNIKKEETKRVKVKYTEKTSEGVKVVLFWHFALLLLKFVNLL